MKQSFIILKYYLFLNFLLLISLLSGCNHSSISKNENTENISEFDSKNIESDNRFSIPSLIQQNKYNSAISLLKKSYNTNKDSNLRLALKDLVLMAECYESTGDNNNAVFNYETALKIALDQYGRSNKNTMHLQYKLAKLYHDNGQYMKAKNSCNMSLEICKEIFPTKINSVYPKILNLMAIIYESLGDYNKAMSLYKKCLKILTDYEKTCSSQQAKIINNIGGIHLRKNEFKDAEKKFKKALSIDVSLNGNDSIETARDFNNLGILYKTTALYSKAESCYLSSISIYNKQYSSYNLNLAMTLNNLGNVYEKTNKYKKAESVLTKALVIAEANKHLELIWHIQDSFRDLYNAQNQPEIAIFFGKKAVNTIQTLRLNLLNINIQLKKTFIKSKAAAYRKLANLLIAQGRFPEARHIIDLLKEEEYQEFMGNDFTRASKKDRNYTKNNSESLFNTIEQNFEEQSTSIFAIDREFEETQKLQRQRVIKQQEAHKKFSCFLEKLKSNIIKNADLFSINDQIRKTEKFEDLTLCSTLKDLNNSVNSKDSDNSKNLKAIVIHYLITDKNLNIILTTSVRSKGYQIPINKTNFYNKIFKFQEQLSKTKGYLSLSMELYKKIFSPVEKDVNETRANIIMLSLDGALRYIPIGTLNDGKKFLAQKYMLTIYSPFADKSLKDKPKLPWSINAMGVTKKAKINEFEIFCELPHVADEIDNIVLDQRKSKNDTNGIINGLVWLNEEFTLNKLNDTIFNPIVTKDQVDIFPVLHIASHFKLDSTIADKSFLLLGDSTTLSLKQIKTNRYQFHNIDLLTLSACETASGNKKGDGIEIDSFATLALKHSAKSVIATLWQVHDESTGIFMQEFYKIYTAKKGITKIQALQEIQSKFIDKKIKSESDIFLCKRSKKNNNVISNNTQLSESQPLDFSHPYYWAPFILIGNWL